MTNTVDDGIVRFSFCKLSGNSVPTEVDDDGNIVPRRSDNTLLSPAQFTTFTPCAGKFVDIFNVIGHRAWSPIIYTNNYRMRKNFKYCELIALDFDDGKWSIKDAEEWLHDTGLEAVIATTKSHQIIKRGLKQCDRFRVVIRANAPTLERDVYEYTVRKVLDETGADPSCKDGARFFYPCKSFHAYYPGNQRIRWADVPYDESDEYLKSVNRRINQFEYRDISKIPPDIWSSIIWGCRPPGRHRLCYIIGAQLGLRGFTVDEIFQFLVKNNSPLLEIGADDVRRAFANGSERALGEISRREDERIGRELKREESQGKSGETI